MMLGLGVANVFAQVGNEWINYGQPYFKIPVARDGIYRLTYADLQAAGFPVSGVDPSRIQIFHRGQEQALLITGDGDGQFDASDYLEFFGRKNDGTQDAQLYRPSSLQPHKYYNLYSDTTAYFLTIGSAPGKRMPLVSGSAGGLTAAPYHDDEKLMVMADQYSSGDGFNSEIYTSSFDTGEGWTGAQVVQTQSIDYTINNFTHGAAAGGVPQLEMLLVGRGPMAHQAEIYAGASMRLLGTINFTGFETYTFSQALTWADVSADNKIVVRLRVVGFGGPDRMSVSYIRLNYPQAITAEGATKKLNLRPDASGKAYIEIANAPTSARIFDITDFQSVRQVSATAAGTLNAVVTNAEVSRTLWVTAETMTPKIYAVSFRQINPAQHDYIIISHPLLRKPAGGYADPVEAYAAYRASEAGGSFDTLVLNTPMIFDEFNYGESSPVAIFNLMKFLSSVKAPRYLFLIGKGIDVWYRYYRNTSTFTIYKDLVPTSGYPGSDMLYTAGLSGTTYEPATPTGRLTAMKPEEVAAYLDKIVETEAKPYDALWRKNVLHLSGGIEEGEPEAFKAYLEGFAVRANDYHFGGRVSAIAKRSRDVQVINIADEVNKGLNLVTFFGHASPSTLDFDIGFVTDPIMGYNNTGKYPVMIMNGCEAGAFFLYSKLFGEDWILASKKGAAGFIAHTSYGLVATLRAYSDLFYETAYQDQNFIAGGVGDIQKETIRKYMVSTFPSVIHLSQIQQMVLLGDPALRLFGAQKPDLEINKDNVSIETFDGKAISAATDSFAVKLIVRNFGIAKSGTIRVEVTRTLNDNSTITYDSLYPTTKYSDTLMFVIRKGSEKGFGNNRLQVTLDPDDVLDEITKDNNTATLNFFVPLNGTKNLFPSAFAIVHDTKTNLSFQATDLLSGERNFLLEVDTVNTFDSPYRKQFSLKGNVLAREPITLLAQDSLVYYWRTRLADPKPGENENWELSSFTYINNGPEGWAQVQFPQYLTNGTDGLYLDGTQRKMDFVQSAIPVMVKTFGSQYPASNIDVSLLIDGSEYNLYRQGFVCRSGTINLVAFDRRSTYPYIGVPFKWYNRAGRACGREPWVINSFAYNELISNNNDDIRAYVNNMATGDSVVLFNNGNAYYSLWPMDAKIKLGEVGISVAQIEALQDGEPVVIFGKKGAAPGTALVFRTSSAPAQQAQLVVNKTITGGFSSGTMRSALIGPARQWEHVYLQAKPAEGSDIYAIDILGVKLNGDEELLRQNLTSDQDIHTISSATYPYLRLQYRVTDDVNLSPQQLRHWLVTFVPEPEGLLLYNGDTSTQSVAEGATWEGSFSFVNLSDQSFTEALTVNVNTFNQDKRLSSASTLQIEAPAPGDTVSFTVPFASADRTGLNDLSVYVNPKVLPEQHYDNNILSLDDYIRVLSDNTPPVLDVTVDGRYLNQNDYVSANPNILIRLWDENPYLFKTDTTGMRIFLTYPCSDNCTPTPIYFNRADIAWSPASPSSDFLMLFKPQNLPEGNYTLRVEGADSRGNSSGVDPYEIDFVVQYASSVIFSNPYPNPFVLDVSLPILIKGREADAVLDWQVVDVWGKVIDEEVNRALVVGTNEIRWSGIDTNGNRVPSGVYIYKMTVSAGGQVYRKIGKLVVGR